MLDLIKQRTPTLGKSDTPNDSSLVYLGRITTTFLSNLFKPTSIIFWESSLFNSKRTSAVGKIDNFLSNNIGKFLSTFAPPEYVIYYSIIFFFVNSF